MLGAVQASFPFMFTLFRAPLALSRSSLVLQRQGPPCTHAYVKAARDHRQLLTPNTATPSPMNPASPRDLTESEVPDWMRDFEAGKLTSLDLEPFYANRARSSQDDGGLPLPVLDRFCDRLAHGAPPWTLTGVNSSF